MNSGSGTRLTLGVMLMPVVFGLALLTGGCNTMRGMGEDVEAAGGAMADTAQKTENKIEDETDEKTQ